MPVGYGSQIQLPNLSLEELSTTKETAGSGLGWLSILLNILEVGGSLLFGPEVGTALALINAGAQTGIEYAETGEVSGSGLALNFGGAALPSVFSGIKNVLSVGKATKFAASAVTDFEDIAKGAASDIKDSLHLASQLNEHARGMQAGFEQMGLTPQQAAEAVQNQLGANFDSIQNSFNIMHENLNVANSSAAAFRDVKITSNPFSNPFKQVGKQVTQNILDQGVKIPVDEIGKSIDSVAKAGERFARGLSGVGEAGADTGADVENKIFRTIQAETGLFKTEINALRGLVKEGEILDLRAFRNILEKAYARTGNLLLEAAIAGAKQGKFLKVLLKSETTAMRLSRYASKTMAWGTKVGGYITSPASLAADAISKTVGKLTSEVEKIGEMLTEKLNKWIKAGKKSLDALEDEFERTGGNLVKSSWIMGYKVLQEDEIMTTILIQFKNKHPNVVTKLTAAKLVEFIEAQSKGRWYINNVARSRGGRKVSELGIEGKLENMLGMLPVAKINEILGFASFSKSFVAQVRANSGTMIWNTSNYIKGFEQGVIQGIIAEGIKGAVGIGVRNQYAKQVLEGGFGAVASGSTFGTAFSTSFAGGAQSMKDTIFEDTTKAGSVVKNVKVIQGTGSAFKGVL